MHASKVSLSPSASSIHRGLQNMFYANKYTELGYLKEAGTHGTTTSDVHPTRRRL